MNETRPWRRAIAVSILTAPVWAAASETAPPALEEIVVTATKHEENARDVPMGLSAMSGDALARTGADSFDDYLQTMPGISYNAAGTGRSMIIIRGISTASFTNENTQSPTALYVDDLPTLNLWSAWTNTDLRTFDVQRVEVLRGPQGTLFGSGSLGGAVRVITNKPDTSGFAAHVEAGMSKTRGGDDSDTVNAMVNVPLIQDQLALRVVGYRVKDGGYIDNTTRNENDTNETVSTGGRLMLAYDATEDLSLRLTVNHQRDEVGDANYTFLRSAAGPKYAYNGVLPAESDTKSNIFNLTAEYDFGPVLLTSSTTYAERDSYLVLDRARFMDFFLGTGLDPASYEEFITHDQKSFAQELRLSSQGEGALRWVAGAFFLEQNIDVQQVWNALAYPEVFLNALYLADPKETALFGEATWSVTDRLDLTAGMRWFHNKFEFEVPVYGGYFPTLVGATTTPYASKTESDVTPRVAFTFKATPDVNVYGTVSRGYRVGQINFGTGVGAADPISGEVIPLTFDPDTLWNYELGVKSSLNGGRLKFNLALFYIDWSDIQIGRDTASGLNYTDNAGDAESKGIELDLQAALGESFEVGLASTYTDAKLTKVLPGVPFETGTMLPGTPRVTVSDYIQWSNDDLVDGLSAYVRLAHRYVGKQISDMYEPESLAPSKKYHALDARAGINFGRYEVVLFVDNLTDNDDAINVIYPGPLDDTETTYRLRPRTVGLTLRADF